MKNTYHRINTKFANLFGDKNKYQRTKLKLFFIRDSSQNKIY